MLVALHLEQNNFQVFETSHGARLRTISLQGALETPEKRIGFSNDGSLFVIQDNYLDRFEIWDLNNGEKIGRFINDDPLNEHYSKQMHLALLHFSPSQWLMAYSIGSVENRSA